MYELSSPCNMVNESLRHLRCNRRLARAIYARLAATPDAAACELAQARLSAVLVCPLGTLAEYAARIAATRLESIRLTLRKGEQTSVRWGGHAPGDYELAR